MGDVTALRTVNDRVGDQAPPRPLFAQGPPRQLALHNLRHLQAMRVITTPAMRLPREEGGQINQDRHRWINPAEHIAHGLTAVTDRLQVTHTSIICSKWLALYSNGVLALLARLRVLGVERLGEVDLDPPTAGSIQAVAPLGE